VVLTQKPDVVIIFFGANDAAFEGQLQHGWLSLHAYTHAHIETGVQMSHALK
jgi:lysophospholipase L1-like esterase